MKEPTGVSTILGARRPQLALLVAAGVLAVLIFPLGMPGDRRDAAAQGNTLTVEVRTCPVRVDADSTDPAHFAETCTEPAAGLTFVVTRGGASSTRTTGADGRFPEPVQNV